MAERLNTAIPVAGVHIAARRHGTLRRLLSDPENPWWERFLTEHGPDSRKKLQGWKSPIGAWLALTLSERVYSGAAAYLLLRKRRVAEWAERAIANGVTQVVCVGVGLDPLSIRIAQAHPGVKCFDVDLQEVIECRTRAIVSSGERLERLALGMVDLTQEPLDRALKRIHGFASNRRTLFILEGLLMYLPAEAAERVLSSLKRCGAAESEAIFTVIDAALLADPKSGISRSARLVAATGNSYRSSYSRDALETLARQLSWRDLDMIDGAGLAERYLPELGVRCGVALGEILVHTTIR